MEIRFLKLEYLNGDRIYQDFLNDRIGQSEEHFDLQIKALYISEAPDFPIYMAGKGMNHYQSFIKTFEILSANYIHLDHEILYDGQFWYSLLLLKKTTFLKSNYPQILNSIREFRNVVMKKFDWENYIYKSLLAVQYVTEHTTDLTMQHKYFDTIVENLDLYNYMIKSPIFRNRQFLINILDIVNDHQLSLILKSKIKNRPDLGQDERYGRRVIYEFNKSYPIILAPMLTKEELEPLFIDNLSKYSDINESALKKRSFWSNLFIGGTNEN